ncbi:TetR family transcriptional regulator [Pigmentiphaga sp. CHJ604]|uniref:TetR/AcrR family transcriptional regulator n=1 Tax=Pigmentiphaga sp. CHJ604 TaxID=3081984 RepID=UPI0030D18C01
MPRVSRQQAEKNRAAIEEASARLIREQGIKGVSVADLMAAAGLTHGGFYGHFESKDALAAAACAKAFAASRERWRERTAGMADASAALRVIVEAYLSPRARDNAGSSCPAASLAVDVARESADKPVRRSYVDGIQGLVSSLAALYGSGDAAADRERALVELSLMVGALLMARATASDPISDQILDAARRHLLPADDTSPTP